MTKVHDHPLFSEAKGIRLFEKRRCWVWSWNGRR
jgi:hypothetical protein